MEIRTQAHAAYRLMYHIVWIPKFRQKIMEDHVHMVAVIPPKYGIAKVIGDIQANSSKELRKKLIEDNSK